MKRLTPSHLYGDHVAQLHHFTRVLPNGCWEFAGAIPRPIREAYYAALPRAA